MVTGDKYTALLNLILIYMNIALVTNFPEIIQFSVTFSFFFLESLFHYHIGKYGTFGIAFPKFKEMAIIIVTILLISGASTLVTNIINDNFLSVYNKKINMKKKYKKKFNTLLS